MIAENEGTVDLISANSIGDLVLGDIENSEIIKNDYNNATGLTVDGTNVISIRSVGNTNVKYTSSGIVGTDEPGYVNSEYLYTLEGSEYNGTWYETNGYDAYNMKREDTNYNSDLALMETLAIRKTDNANRYIISSRNISAYNENVSFSLYEVDGIGDFMSCTFFNLYENANMLENNIKEMSVRPIVTLNASELGW